MEKIRNESTDLLCQVILTLKSVDEVYDFLEDICTVKEIKAIAQRVVVARMLLDKKIYSDIVVKTGASTATISRVNRTLYYGKDSYRLVFDRID